MKEIEIQGVKLHLCPPLENDATWIAQETPLKQLQACWYKVVESDILLTPRLIGPPGLGKTTLAMAAAALIKQDVWLMQCTADTRPEDLLITPVIAESGKINYHASPLLTAVIMGGVAILDEGNRMSEKSWASLAGLLDHRRTVESVIAGITVKAHPEFRCVTTMNDDSSTFEIPDYIHSRLQPGIELPFPDREAELAILRYNTPFENDELLAKCVDYMQKAHDLDLPYSIRDGLNIVNYAYKWYHANDSKNIEECFWNSVKQILGEEAVNLEKLASIRKNMFGNIEESSLENMFFSEDDMGMIQRDEDDDDLDLDFDDDLED